MFPTPIRMPGGVSRAVPGNTAGRSTVDSDRYPTGYMEIGKGEVLTGMREVSMSEFVKAHAAGAAVIDVGEVEEYNRGHIPGAVSLPLRGSVAGSDGRSLPDPPGRAGVCGVRRR